MPLLKSIKNHKLALIVLVFFLAGFGLAPRMVEKSTAEIFYGDYSGVTQTINFNVTDCGGYGNSYSKPTPTNTYNYNNSYNNPIYPANSYKDRNGYICMPPSNYH